MLNTIKSSSLRRGMSFSTLVLTGHLFDTLFFNQVINILEKNKMDFRVIEIEVGNISQKTSTATLQIVAKNHSMMDKAMDEIEKEA